MNKIPDTAKSKTIPLTNSLMITKSAIGLGIDGYTIKHMNYIDLQTLIFSLSIDDINKYLKQKRSQKLSEKGIKEIKPATEEDFDSL